MGNYHNLQSEFIQRTLRLIDQYYDQFGAYPFNEQFNYTLMINCLLGLIVMPKEKVIDLVPNDLLTPEFLASIGAPSTELGENVTTLRRLIISLRNAVAHFDINVISINGENLIDFLEFSDSRNGGALVAKFRANELLPFLRHYSQFVLQSIETSRAI